MMSFLAQAVRASFMGFSGGSQALVELDQRGVPAEGGGQRGGEQRAAQAAAPAGDMALALAQAAVVVVGCEAGECGGLFAADGPSSGMRTTMATAVRSPMPGMLRTRSR